MYLDINCTIIKYNNKKDKNALQAWPLGGKQNEKLATYSNYYYICIIKFSTLCFLAEITLYIEVKQACFSCCNEWLSSFS